MIETVQSFCSQLHWTSFPVVNGFPSVSSFSLQQCFCILATFVQSILFDCELDLGSFS